MTTDKFENIRPSVLVVKEKGNTSLIDFAGTVKAFAGDTTNWSVINGVKQEDKWGLCEGQILSQTEFPELYNRIGSLWNDFVNPHHTPAGTVDTATQFRLPDFRGLYLRGKDAELVGSFLEDKTAVNGIELDDNSHSHTVNKNQWNSNQNGHSHQQVITNSVNTGALPDVEAPSYTGGVKSTRYGNVVNTRPSTATWTASNANTNSVTHNHGISGDAETMPNSAVVQYIIALEDKTIAGGTGGTGSGEGLELVECDHTTIPSTLELSKHYEVDLSGGSATVAMPAIQEGKRIFIQPINLTDGNILTVTTTDAFVDVQLGEDTEIEITNNWKEFVADTVNTKWNIIDAFFAMSDSIIGGGSGGSGGCDCPPASATENGLMTTGDQQFAGDKEFLGQVTIDNLVAPNYAPDVPIATTTVNGLVSTGGQNWAGQKILHNNGESLIIKSTGNSNYIRFRDVDNNMQGYVGNGSSSNNDMYLHSYDNLRITAADYINVQSDYWTCDANGEHKARAFFSLDKTTTLSYAFVGLPNRNISYDDGLYGIYMVTISRGSTGSSYGASQCQIVAFAQTTCSIRATLYNSNDIYTVTDGKGYYMGASSSSSYNGQNFKIVAVPLMRFS